MASLVLALEAEDGDPLGRDHLGYLLQTCDRLGLLEQLTESRHPCRQRPIPEWLPVVAGITERAKVYVLNTSSIERLGKAGLRQPGLA